MPPELIHGQNPTPASDIYSLGIVLYEMATGGERPFTGEQAKTSGATSEKVRWEQVFLSPPKPRQYNPAISDQTEAVIMRCLAKEPEKRFSSAVNLFNALELASAGNLDTQNWPNLRENKVSNAVPMPLVRVQSNQLASAQQKIQKSGPQAGLANNKLIIALGALFLIGICGFVLLMSFGRNWTRGNQSDPTQLEGSPVAALSSVLAEAGTQESAPTVFEAIPTTIATQPQLNEPTPTTATNNESIPNTSVITSTPKSSAYITPTPKRYYPLSNCAGSHLRVGDSAFVSYTGGKNNLRNEPDTHPSNNVIGAIYPGEVVIIVDGPVCNYGWILWEVLTTNDERGWTPETNGDDYWILPLTTRQLCDGALPTRLVVGKKAKVNEQPPDANLIRVEPSRFDEVIGRIPPGEWMTVLEGPHCGEKANWWKVKAISTGIVGWTMEGNLDIYYLSPEP